MQPTKTHRTIPTVGAIAALTLLAGACAGDDEVAEPSLIEISAVDYGLAADTPTVTGGSSVIALTNDGEDIHHLQMWQVDDADAAAARIRDGDLSVLAGATAVGGVGAIGPGATHRVASEVGDGEYVVFCVIETPAGPHHELGMVATLTVDGESDAEEPTADTELRITADGFDLPDGWDGTTDLAVVNEHGVPADAEFLRLVDGADKDDVLGFLGGMVPGPPPFTTEGGVAGLGPGRTSVMLDEIPPGDYLVASFQPDPELDIPQFLSGHMVEFTVG